MLIKMRAYSKIIWISFVNLHAVNLISKGNQVPRVQSPLALRLLLSVRLVFVRTAMNLSMYHLCFSFRWYSHTPICRRKWWNLLLCARYLQVSQIHQDQEAERGAQVMNCDEGTYFLSHVYDQVKTSHSGDENKHPSRGRAVAGLSYYWGNLLTERSNI